MGALLRIELSVAGWSWHWLSSTQLRSAPRLNGTSLQGLDGQRGFRTVGEAEATVSNGAGDPDRRSALGAALDVTMESERLIRVEGRQLRVRRSGTGPPILLLNGMGMSLSTWAPLDRHLDGFDRIRVGTPGTGGILARQPVLTMRNFAALLGDLLDQLAIERADVLGLSFGGMVAQQFAHDMPNRVRRLVLASTSCGLGGAPSNPASWWNAMLTDMWPTPSGWGPRWLARQWSQLMLREFGDRWASGPRLSGFAGTDCGGVTVDERGVVAAAHPRDFGDHRHRRCVGALRECEHSGVQNASRSDLPCPWRRASVLVGSGR